MQTNNVIAETPGGRADRTVVVGGHLDSVYAGPGINDDGSGVSMMMETAQQMAVLGIQPRNKVRFIFFSGEEQGLLGSDVLRVPAVEAAGQRHLGDAGLRHARVGELSPGSSTTATVTSRASPARTAPALWSRSSRTSGTARALPTRRSRSTAAPITTRSPTAGIPAGGIFAGAEHIKQPYQVPLYGGTAGVAFDPCYHQLCDTLANINEQGLEEHSDAAVNAILTFAQTPSAVNGTDKGCPSSTKSWDWKGNHQFR